MLAVEITTGARERSQESRAFEAAWRRARGAALVLDRNFLELRHFKAMLSDMLLMEFFPDEPARSCIRVVGEAIRERLQRNIVGCSHFDFMPEQRRIEAANLLRKVVTHPCGLRHSTVAHYERGYSHCYEMTALPLWNAGHPPQIMVMIVPCHGQALTVPNGFAAVSLEEPRDLEFLDIGAGVPF